MKINRRIRNKAFKKNKGKLFILTQFGMPISATVHLDNTTQKYLRCDGGPVSDLAGLGIYPTPLGAEGRNYNYYTIASQSFPVNLN